MKRARVYEKEKSVDRMRGRKTLFNGIELTKEDVERKGNLAKSLSSFREEVEGSLVFLGMTKESRMR